MKRVIKKMTDSGGGLAVSISMLDVISNALAATLILFFTTAALQVQAPLPPQVLGQCVIDVQFLPQVPGAEPPTLILLSPKCKSGAEKINEGINISGDWHPDNTPKDIKGLPPRCGLYRDPNNPLNQTIVMYDPIAGKWQLQVLYTDHDLYEKQAVGASAQIRVWFESTATGERVEARTETKHFKFTTNRQVIEFTIDPIEFQP